MNQILTDEDGNKFEVVDPGSPSDPFSSQVAPASPPLVASPAPIAQAEPPVTRQADGPQVQTPAVPQPTPAPVAPTSATPATATPSAEPAKVPESDAKPVEVDVQGLIKEAVGNALRSQQSAYDKRIAGLEQAAKEAREASARAERDAKLNSPDLTEDERAVLRDKYALEDKQAELDAYADELDRYHRSIYIGALVQEHGKFGVTVEALEAFEEPEQMDAFVKDAELTWYKAGNHATQQVPDRVTQPNASADPKVPAGATAPTDVMGTPPPAPAAKWDDGQSPDSLARNLNSLPWETVPIN
jgi:hypothetical protein